jgi:DNA-binding GntR family transcriptional regulator
LADHDALSIVFGVDADDQPRIERSLLKDQAIEVLRDHLVSGRIPPGTKLVERELASLLGISRAPVREALLELEKEGLIVTKSNGRYAIRLTERDVRELYQVRLALERLAVELAAQNTCPENRAALNAKLEAMREAVAKQDREIHVTADVETHWLIWRQANNDHLFRMLSSMIGPIFMFVANNADAFDWHETCALHEELVSRINDGDVRGSVTSLDLHMDNALHRSLQVFHNGD